VESYQTRTLVSNIVLCTGGRDGRRGRRRKEGRETYFSSSRLPAVQGGPAFSLSKLSVISSS
jgi:hypothetical protein